MATPSPTVPNPGDVENTVDPKQRTTQFAVCVPRLNSSLRSTIDGGSAIVCAENQWQLCNQVSEASYLTVDYEGARHAPMTYGIRVLHAAGRQAQRYPTVARALIQPGELVQVGTFDLSSTRLTLFETSAADLEAFGVGRNDYQPFMGPGAIVAPRPMTAKQVYDQGRRIRSGRSLF